MEKQALGMIETRGLVGSIEAADAMAKAAIVNLTEWLATYFAPAGMDFIRDDPRGEPYRGLDWSHEYDMAINGDPTDTQSAL